MASHMLRFVVTALRMSQTVFYVNCRFNGRRVRVGKRSVRPAAPPSSALLWPSSTRQATPAILQPLRYARTLDGTVQPQSCPRHHCAGGGPSGAETPRHSCQRRCPRASVLRSMVEVYWGYLPRPFKGWRTASIAPAAKAFPCFLGRHAACCGSPATGNGLLASSAALAIRAIPPPDQRQSRHEHRASAGVCGALGGLLLLVLVLPIPIDVAELPQHAA